MYACKRKNIYPFTTLAHPCKNIWDLTPSLERAMSKYFRFVILLTLIINLTILEFVKSLCKNYRYFSIQDSLKLLKLIFLKFTVTYN